LGRSRGPVRQAWRRCLAMNGPPRDKEMRIVLWCVLALAATAFLLFVTR
jgi:hypothetical protein